MFELSEQRAQSARVADPLTQGSVGSSWPDFCGHWLRSPTVAELELEAHTRRLAAVQRWRGERGAAFACR
jgi:hypothetical protein